MTGQVIKRLIFSVCISSIFRLVLIQQFVAVPLAADRSGKCLGNCTADQGRERNDVSEHSGNSDTAAMDNDTAAIDSDTAAMDSDTAVMDAEGNETIQGQLCSERCNGTQKTNVTSNTRCLQCYPCTCESPCAKHGTCCPQLGQAWRPPHVERTQCKEDVRSNLYIRHVVACATDFAAGHVRQMCESPPQPRTRDTGLPVTSTETNVTYANTYCAACHDDNRSVVEWVVTCRHSQLFYNVTSDEQYDQLALQRPDLCNTSPTLGGQNYYSCRPQLELNVISSCNVTGTWKEPDEDLRRGCEESDRSIGAVVFFTVAEYRNDYSTRVYANAMCALCNEDRIDVLQRQCPHRGDHQIVIRPVTRLVQASHGGSTISVTNVTMGCGEGRWKHPGQGECRPLHCSPGKKLAPGDICRTAVHRVRGLGYHIRLLLTPVMLQFTGNLTSTEFAEALSSSHTSLCSVAPPLDRWNGSDSMREASSNGMFPRGSVSTTRPCHYRATVAQAMQTHLTALFWDRSMNITAASSSNGTCFLEANCHAMEKLLQQRTITYGTQLDGRDFVALNLSSLPKADTSFLQAEIEAYAIAISEPRDSVEERAVTTLFHTEWQVRSSGWTVTLKATDLTSNFGAGENVLGDAEWETDGLPETYSLPYLREPKFRPQADLEHLYLPLNGLLTCPRVTLEPHEFEVKGSRGHVQVVFPNYRDADMKQVTFSERFHPSAAWLTPEGPLEMCLDAFRAVFPLNIVVIRPTPELSMAHQITGAVCSGLSVLCLALTFLTYALFEQLRSLPGLNNMALSLSLALAQLTLLVPWHRTSSPALCTIVGVVTHWAWLVALGWMSVCCQHMARVFMSKTHHSLTARETRQAFLRSAVSVVALSTAVVVVTATTSLIASRGSSVGYGGDACFLDTGLSQLVLLAFVVPLGLVVFIDLACFLFAVLAIARVRRLHAQPASGWRGLAVYAKLVTVTGGAWMLSLLAGVVDSEWMLVVAELFIASQGLLIFLAYVCNVRVWRLYRSRFGCASQDSSSRTPCTGTTLAVTSRSNSARETGVLTVW